MSTKTFKFEGARGSGAKNWYMQRITGILLVVVLIGHYILMHATPEAGHTYKAVMERLHQPVWKIIDMTFVTLGLWHGLNGLWNVIRDYELRPWLATTIYTILVLVALAFWFLGLNTILAF
jgi:succinate dehydrogenase / fumarate reductase, membrane anchor subunit